MAEGEESKSDYRAITDTAIGEMVYPKERLPDVLAEARAKLENQGYLEVTGVWPALQWYREPDVVGEKLTLELCFISYWLALEALADAHARGTLNGLARALEEKGLTGGQWDWVLGTLRDSLFAPGRDKDKLRALLSDCGLPAYTKDINSVYDRRSKLVHTGIGISPGKETRGSGLAMDTLRAKRLVEKVVCIRLGIYGSYHILGAIIHDDLLAREAPKDYNERIEKIRTTGKA